MSGKLIVFEGTDGSGKATQAQLLCQRLAAGGHRLSGDRLSPVRQALRRAMVQAVSGRELWANIPET